ncbi:hypothetical protein [Bacillus thuringiensis]|uniref:hypothetical protein n=1 Tax=Bacillus cereus group TaxID=86661 RepID=UPI00078787C0|nr:hypothetical protein [Bacillus thuringiensis]AMR85665.1 hypothetical protein A3L20_17080 [Bacillus thuringiensis]MBG9639332.1 hypothetical protein [Bacillus thuringiensis]MBG9673558.1 hypothetical protein [Bacillus thuringiensis]MDR5026199.1 hypothetical protein [Bacillus thuringiensis]MEC3297682.1 hypothetical protein [Bacillus thuringiensis]
MYMQKEEWVQRLKEGRYYVTSYENIMKKIHKRPSRIPGILIAFVLLMILPRGLFSYNDTSSMFIMWVFLIVFVAAWPSIIHVFRKFTASKYDPQIQEYDQKFQSSIPIPIKYFSVKKIDACIVALESGAADDLKEALAIWQVTETSTVQYTLLEEQNTLLKQQIRTTKQAANAARDAADAVDQLRR